MGVTVDHPKSGEGGAATAHYCGYIAIVGRPNVGKSTLLNRLVNKKLSITSRKPQTTRHRILGIKSTGNCQLVYVDTPGLHAAKKRAMDRYMNRTAVNAIDEVDLSLFVVEALRWLPDDALVAHRLARSAGTVLVAVNKIDQVMEKSELLPYMEKISRISGNTDMVPISARRGEGVDALEQLLLQHLPEGPPVFPEDQATDRSERFFVSEIIREKLTRVLGEELPYRLTVEVESYSEGADCTRIGAIVWVERFGQKKIVVGTGGKVLKNAGTQARRDIERMLDKKVYLQLWVKVKQGWSDDERTLQRLGYVD